MLAALTAACGDESVDPEVVARVGAYELRVPDVVQLLADREEYPARADVVEGLAGLWIDYTLLSSAAAEDSTLGALDFASLVRERLDQEMLRALGDSAIQVDTLVTEAQLRERYEGDSADVRYHARHIMMGYPLGATPEQRDSVRARLEDLRGQIERGASFVDLARRFSQDTGTASLGGDLGTFGPGEMVRPFEDAVRGLEPGQVSGVVETPMGLHLVRLDERTRVPFADVAGSIRARILAERSTQAESLFVAGIEERVGGPEVADGAADILRELAANPSIRLSGRAARRPLVEWSGGSLTAGRVLDVLRFEQPTFHQQVAAGDDEALETFLGTLARRELLVAQARASGLGPDQARADSLVADLRGQLVQATRRLGLHPLDRAPGEQVERAVARASLAAIDRNLSGAVPPVPLGPLGWQLRSRTPNGVQAAGVGRVVLRLGQIRVGRGPSAGEQGPGTPPPAPDTGIDGDGS